MDQLPKFVKTGFLRLNEYVIYPFNPGYVF